VLDYVGLMKSSSMQRGISKYQQLSEITQDLKHIARTMKTPIIMAAQTNRHGAKDGADLDNVADSISIAQDSDLVFGMFQDEDMAERKQMEIRLSKNRDGPRGKLKARWDFDENSFRERDGGDMFQKRSGSIGTETSTGAKISFMKNRTPVNA
jgi:replicative DNA helicase